MSNREFAEELVVTCKTAEVHVNHILNKLGFSNRVQIATRGVYDVAANTGWLSVGVEGDTAAFAVETLRRWWVKFGRRRHRKAKRLLVSADTGGASGFRVRLWKRELAQLANETGLAITVCQFPPGTSKWNRIEHRLFAHISMNWRGP